MYRVEENSKNCVQIRLALFNPRLQVSSVLLALRRILRYQMPPRRSILLELLGSRLACARSNQPRRPLVSPAFRSTLSGR